MFAHPKLNLRRLGRHKHVKNLNHTGSHDHHQKESNECFAHGELIIVLGSFSDRNVAALGNVFVKLFSSIAEVAWSRLQTIV